MLYKFSAEQPSAEEVSELFESVGWHADSLDAVATSLNAYPCKVCARTSAGVLIGYASVFSDTVMTTMLGELIVHPDHRRAGVGKGIMDVIETLYPNAPIYIKALGEAKHFFARLGFKQSSMEMTAMFKRPRPGAKLLDR